MVSIVGNLPITEVEGHYRDSHLLRMFYAATNSDKLSDSDKLSVRPYITSRGDAQSHTQLALWSLPRLSADTTATPAGSRPKPRRSAGRWRSDAGGASSALRLDTDRPA